MKKEIKQTATKLTRLLGHVKMKGILPFKEKPSVNSFSSPPDEDKDKGTKRPLNASELFSIFTADIIKEDVTFIR